MLQAENMAKLMSGYGEYVFFPWIFCEQILSRHLR